jgi:hypothetical protein
MASYGDYLSPDDIDALVAYVKWIHDGSWKPLLR